MSEKVPAAAEAKTWLKWAEKGYSSKYGSCPLETRIVIGRAWIELARIEADIEIAKIAASASAEVLSTDTANETGEDG